MTDMDAPPDVAADDAPRFLADAMLERLARWLRALGYDATSAGEAPDAEVVQRAAVEGRWLLTRDRRMAGDAPPSLGVLLRAGPPLAQLREVVERFRLATDAVFTRCLVCNAELRPATPAELDAALPPALCARHRPDAARTCPACGRVYWEGSHTRRMRAALRRTFAGDVNDAGEA